MKLISLLVLTAFTLTARAETYPVLGQFQTAAEELVTLTTGATAADAATLQQKTRDLIEISKGILTVYAAKIPACAAQYEVFTKALPEMESMTLDEVSEAYHDGKSLPSAPRYCYLGRSETIHPMMNLIRLKGAWSESVRQDTLADLDEVLEHIPLIQRNLDNPPH